MYAQNGKNFVIKSDLIRSSRHAILVKLVVDVLPAQGRMLLGGQFKNIQSFLFYLRRRDPTLGQQGLGRRPARLLFRCPSPLKNEFWKNRKNEISWKQW